MSRIVIYKDHWGETEYIDLEEIGYKSKSRIINVNKINTIEDLKELNDKYTLWYLPVWVYFDYDSEIHFEFRIGYWGESQDPDFPRPSLSEKNILDVIKTKYNVKFSDEGVELVPEDDIEEAENDNT